MTSTANYADMNPEKDMRKINFKEIDTRRVCEIIIIASIIAGAISLIVFPIAGIMMIWHIMGETLGWKIIGSFTILLFFAIFTAGLSAIGLDS